MVESENGFLTVQMNLCKHQGVNVYPVLPLVGDSIREVDVYGRAFGRVGKVLHNARSWKEGMTVEWDNGGIEFNVRCRSRRGRGRSKFVFA